MGFIPKIIHQVWIGPKSPPMGWINTWKEKHPSFIHYLWNEERYQKTNWRLQEQMDSYYQRDLYSGVADLMRYEILYEYGGFAAEADSECLESIDELVGGQDYKAFTVYENEEARPGLYSMIMASQAGYELFDEVIKEASEKSTESGSAWKTTGNCLFTDVVKNSDYSIKVLPSHTFIPTHFSGVKYEGDGKVYATQYWGSTDAGTEKRDY